MSASTAAREATRTGADGKPCQPPAFPSFRADHVGSLLRECCCVAAHQRCTLSPPPLPDRSTGYDCTAATRSMISVLM